MKENIEKAQQGAAMLVEDLHDVCKSAIDNNDALYVLTMQLIEQAAKIRDILAALQRV